MRPTANLLLAAALALVGCTPDAEISDRANLQKYDEVRAEGAPAGFALTAAAVETRAAQRSADLIKIRPTPEPSSLVIRNGQTSIEVDSLERAVAQVRLLAGRVGGYVANTTMQTGRGQLRAATLEVKIPADDVGEEFTDVTARMTNARRLETRLIDLLATRTGKLKDVLDVEHELARVREEIERYEGRLRYLRAHAVLSTLTVYVHEPVPVVGRAGSSVIGEAFKQAWRNFVALVAACIRGLGIVIPLGALVTAAWLGAKRLSLLPSRLAGR